jgi:copper chaperone CopZ
MKYILITLLAIGSAAGLLLAGDGAGCGAVKQTMVNLNVRDISTAESKEKLANALQAIEGVSTTEIDAQSGLVKVTVDSSVANADQLLATVRSAGFEAALASN